MHLYKDPYINIDYIDLSLWNDLVLTLFIVLLFTKTNTTTAMTAFFVSAQ